MITNPTNLNFTKPFPTRLVASGSLTLQGATGQTFAGQNARQDRYQFFISNMDVSQSLYLRNSRGVPFLTVFPSVAITLITSEDIEVWNPNGTAMVFIVGELFYDEGTAAVQAQAAAKNAAAAGGSSGSYSGATSGGYSGGGANSSYSRGGSAHTNVP